MTRFVLLSSQRSGSTWVVDMLNSHPCVIAYSELFLAGARGKPEWGGAKDQPFFETYVEQSGGDNGPDGVARYLNRVLAPKTGISAIGFKLMYGQLTSRSGIVEYMLRRRVRVIHLTRNLLDIVLSEEASARRGIFHARRGEHIEPVSLALAGSLPTRLRQKDAKRKAMGKRFQATPLRYMEIRYEDLVEDHAQFDRLLEFLGTAPTTLSSSLVQLNRAAHSELIENYEEVRERLAGTPYESLLR